MTFVWWSRGSRRAGSGAGTVTPGRGSASPTVGPGGRSASGSATVSLRWRSTGGGTRGLVVTKVGPLWLVRNVRCLSSGSKQKVRV